MKSTKIKVSVSQDGLLPQETAELAIMEFPVFQKKLLKALGFERVDASTFVGVLPVFVHLKEKHQEIEIELGVNLPEMRKKILEVLLAPSAQTKPVEVEEPAKKTAGKPKKSPKTSKAKAVPAKAIKTTKTTKSTKATKPTTAKKTATRKTKGKK
ncbi:MAG: hypothetical protein ACR2NW_08165 [Thermodesulfobacteriota bacterium]